MLVKSNRQNRFDQPLPVSDKKKISLALHGPVICGVLNDIHYLGLYVIKQFLEHQGVRVVRLGTMVRQEDFVGAVQETRVVAVLGSTFNGMGHVDAISLKEKFIEAGLEKNYPLYWGR